jgi:hypothetical protein
VTVVCPTYNFSIQLNAEFGKTKIIIIIIIINFWQSENDHGSFVDIKGPENSSKVRNCKRGRRREQSVRERSRNPKKEKKWVTVTCPS